MGWMVSSTPRPHFTPGKEPVPILQEAGWAPGPVWTGGKSRPHRDSIPDRPARSQSLYRLSCRAHINLSVILYKTNHIYVYTVNRYNHAKFDVLTAVTLNYFLWNVKPCSLVDINAFEEHAASIIRMKIQAKRNKFLQVPDSPGDVQVDSALRLYWYFCAQRNKSLFPSVCNGNDTNFRIASVLTDERFLEIETFFVW